ncbi:MAG TPA: peptidoglycan DD-metalloendopeptidase family protein [Microvirga sp.]|nr:peptidoglycan DD-metalloendopeptidase family protein [Microvirga sp.]
MCSGRWTAVSRVALVSLIGGVASACSSDTVRFSEPFANPFTKSERLAASEPQPQQQANTQVAAVPTPRVQSQALPPVEAAPAPRVASAPVTSSSGGWTAAGGTRIRVAAGDSLDTLSQRYGVPSSAILSANGLSSSSQVAAGREIVIPIYSAAGSTKQAAAAPAQPKFRLVEGPKPAAQSKPEKAAAKGVQTAETAPQRVRPGMAAAPRKERTPAQQVVAAAPVAAPAAPRPASARATAQPAAVQAEPQPARPAAGAQAAAPAAQPVAAAAPSVPAEPDQTGALSTDFRWPARGRVIAGFGANGGNEGINIALPEGTPVKAAEAGTVTYAGNEVKGYGNLVLVRHDNGYVSAYAHNGSLSVKRGERVKRGQVIATSGQTGNVTSPQLHFELRKGQTPVDPIPHLSGS